MFSYDSHTGAGVIMDNPFNNSSALVGDYPCQYKFNCTRET